MEIKTQTRVARSWEALDRILSEIETGKKKKPDWIALQSECRLDKLGKGERKALLARLHPNVLRGFKANTTSRSRRRRSASTIGAAWPRRVSTTSPISVG